MPVETVAPRTMHVRSAASPRALLLPFVAACLLCWGCTGPSPSQWAESLGTPAAAGDSSSAISGVSASGASASASDTPAAAVLRPRADPSEFTGLRLSRSLAPDELLDALDRAYGDAFDSNPLQGFEIAPGVRLHALEDERSREQVILVAEMDVSSDAEPATRTVAMLPASRDTGALFLETLRAAIERVEESDADFGAQPVLLEHRLQSAMGGRLTLRAGTDAGGWYVGVDMESPRTDLSVGRINAPWFSGPPVESLYGRVYFSLSRDDFDFFSTRAYGVTAGAAQNFRDFRLLPHDWLRLTVTPMLDDDIVDVAFEVVTVDGQRVDLARAPASLRAGEQFMQNVFRMVDNMEAAEAEEAGSSRPFEVPFYYDDPEGGGIVEVIAVGREGRFQIAYAVESPVRRLQDVEFVPYVGEVEVPEDWDAVDPSCDDVGSEVAAQGFFDITFDASPTVRRSNRLEAPLRGHVWGSVYRAQDVTIAGPRDGTSAAADFFFEDVDITDRDNLSSFRLDTPLNAGAYQILGFMDIQDRADPESANPSAGDPVMIPIGGYRMRCAEQPITVEFAILLPEGR